MKTSIALMIAALGALYTPAKAADVFSLPTNEDVFYENGQSFNEYLIYTPDKKCLLHYLSQTPIDQTSQIEITQRSELDDVQCLEKGFASVNVTNGKDTITLNGYFLNGFYIGATPLNSYAIKRSADPNGTQNLYYFIDKDDELAVRYIGKMRAYPMNGAYTSFEVCSPFEVVVQTQNKDLFKENDTIQNIFTVVKSYALTLCPKVQTIVFGATDSPSLDKDGVFFQEYLNKDPNSVFWLQDPNQSFNYVMAPDTKPEKSQQELAPQQEQAQKTQGQALNLLQEEPLQTPSAPTVEHQKQIIHIADVSNNKAIFIDQPYLMKAYKSEQTSQLKTGWYEVVGDITPMDDWEKKRSGISLNEKAAMIEIITATPCANDQCR